MCDWCSYHYSNRTFIQAVASLATRRRQPPLTPARPPRRTASRCCYQPRAPATTAAPSRRGRLLLLSAIDRRLEAEAGGVSGRNWAVCAGQEQVCRSRGGVTPGLFHFSDWFSSFLDVSRAESATTASYPGGGD